MKTLKSTLVLLVPVLLVGGCYPFDTVEDACLDKAPGDSNIEDPDAVELIRRGNCYRRLAKRPRMRVNPQVQDAVEGHASWIELNNPDIFVRSIFTQINGTDGFTGVDVASRLSNADYIFTSNTEVLEVGTLEADTAAGAFVGADQFDLWFADPFLRPAFLQTTINGVGVEQGDFVVPGVEDLGIADVPVHYMYWNLIYQVPPQPFAESPTIYPRNGQTDAPARYTHVSSSSALEFGRTYGYPVTFTVGVKETGLQVTQASFTGPTGQVPFLVLEGADAITASRFRNSAILVPELPLTTGSTYQVDVRIQTDQGERRARTSFTVGGDSVEIPPELLARAVELDMPLLSYRARELGPVEASTRVR